MSEYIRVNGKLDRNDDSIFAGDLGERAKRLGNRGGELGIFSMASM